MPSNKINWVSILQGWTIFLVVLGHCSIWTDKQWCMDFCYGVHMPMFFFISGGLFYKTRIQKRWIWADVVIDKIKRLGIPYLFFIAFAYVIKIILVNNVKNGVDISVWGFVEGFIFPFKSGMKEMWFVAALLLMMWCYPLYPYILKNKYVLFFVLTVSFVTPYIFTSYVGGGFFNWQGAVRYFIFFICGQLYFKYKFFEKFTDIRIGILFLLIYLLICTFRKDQTVIVGFVGIMAFVQISLWYANKKPDLLNSFRNYSFQIFLLGIYPQMFVELFLCRMFDESWIKPLLLVISVLLGIYAPILVVKMAERIQNKTVNMILGLK